MKKLYLVINLLVVVLFVTACGEKIYTVSEFKENDKLRNEFLNKCTNGEKVNPANCENAQRAKFGF